MEKLHKGDGFAVIEKDGRFYIEWPQGHGSHIASFEISRENMEKAFRSPRDSYEVMMFAQNGRWPPTEAEQMESQKNFLRKFPDLLITIPKNQEYFNEEELKILLPLGQKALEEEEFEEDDDDEEDDDEDDLF